MMTGAAIPFIDLSAQYDRFRARIDARLAGVFRHGRFILGPEVAELEEALARFSGAESVVGVASGTDALLISLLEAGIGPGDGVLVPSFSFIATAGAVVSAGATPVFCDVDPETFNVGVRELSRGLSSLPQGLRPRAIIVADLFGLPADYQAIGDFAEEHRLAVIADAAQSFGGGRDGLAVGRLAQVTATSFFPTKPLGAYGDAGAIFTDDPERAARLRAIRVHGQDSEGEFRFAGLNSRLDTLQAAVLLAKFESLPRDLARRAEIAARYDRAFAEYLELQARPAGTVSANAAYAILHDSRNALQDELARQGIATRIYYEKPLHQLPAMRRFSEGLPSLPVCERLSRQILHLPIYPELSDEAVERVCEAVLEALTKQPGARQQQQIARQA